MEPVKKEVIDLVNKLPDDVNMDEIMYRLYVLDKIRKGQADGEAGRVTNQEDLEHAIESW